jgi:hypothetical protein
VAVVPTAACPSLEAGSLTMRRVYAQQRVRKNARDGRRSSQEDGTTKSLRRKELDNLDELLTLIADLLR